MEIQLDGIVKIILRKKETEITIDIEDEPKPDMFKLEMQKAINAYKVRLMDKVSTLPDRPAKSVVRRSILDIII